MKKKMKKSIDKIDRIDDRLDILLQQGRSAGILELVIKTNPEGKPLLIQEALDLNRRINQGLKLIKIIEEELIELKKVKKTHTHNWNMYIEPKYEDLKKLLNRSKK